MRQIWTKCREEKTRNLITKMILYYLFIHHFLPSHNFVMLLSLRNLCLWLRVSVQYLLRTCFHMKCLENNWSVGSQSTNVQTFYGKTSIVGFIFCKNKNNFEPFVLNASWLMTFWSQFQQQLNQMPEINKSIIFFALHLTAVEKIKYEKVYFSINRYSRIIGKSRHSSKSSCTEIHNEFAKYWWLDWASALQ